MGTAKVHVFRLKSVPKRKALTIPILKLDTPPYRYTIEPHQMVATTKTTIPTPKKPKPSPPPFQYSPKHPITSSQPRTTLLFDLDETLVSTQWLYPHVTHENDYRTEMVRFPEHSRGFISDSNIVHYRPGVIPFLKRCLAHCHVAFWSTGGKIYVERIVRRLMHDCREPVSSLLFVWARSNAPRAASSSSFDSQTTPPLNRRVVVHPANAPREVDRIRFVDVFTGEYITRKTSVHPPNTPFRTSDSHKDLQLVFERFPKLSRNHVVLLDNLPNHSVGNDPANVAWIPPFSYLNIHDTVLRTLCRLIPAVPKPPTAKTGDSTASTKTPKPPKPTASITPPKPTTSTTKPSPPRFNANTIRKALSTVSPTNNQTLYPSGYLSPFLPTVYRPDPARFKEGKWVIVPYGEEFAMARIKTVDRVNERLSVEAVARMGAKTGVVGGDTGTVLEEDEGTNAKGTQKGTQKGRTRSGTKSGTTTRKATHATSLGVTAKSGSATTSRRIRRVRLEVLFGGVRCVGGTKEEVESVWGAYVDG